MKGNKVPERKKGTERVRVKWKKRVKEEVDKDEREAVRNGERGPCVRDGVSAT